MLQIEPKAMQDLHTLEEPYPDDIKIKSRKQHTQKGKGKEGKEEWDEGCEGENETRQIGKHEAGKGKHKNIDQQTLQRRTDRIRGKMKEVFLFCLHIRVSGVWGFAKVTMNRFLSISTNIGIQVKEFVHVWNSEGTGARVPVGVWSPKLVYCDKKLRSL